MSKTPNHADTPIDPTLRIPVKTGGFPHADASLYFASAEDRENLRANRPLTNGAIAAQQGFVRILG